MDDGDCRNFVSFLQMGISWKLVHSSGYPSCLGDRSSNEVQSSKLKAQSSKLKGGEGMKQENLWLILGMAVVTFIPRFIPMAFLSRRAIPERIKVGLEYIPVAILSCYCLSNPLFRRTRSFYSSTSAPTFCHTCFCLCLESKKPLGIGCFGNAGLLGIGIYLYKTHSAWSRESWSQEIWFRH